MARTTCTNSALGQKQTFNLPIPERYEIRDLPDFDLMSKVLLVDRYTSRSSFIHKSKVSEYAVLKAFERNTEVILDLADHVTFRTALSDCIYLTTLAEDLGIHLGALLVRYELVGGTLSEVLQPWYDTICFAGENYTDVEFKKKFKYTISEVAGAGGYTTAIKIKNLSKLKVKSKTIEPYSKLFLK